MNVNATKISVAGAVVCLVALGWVLFSSSGRDDAYITFWSAHTLATNGEITNYNGETVEQSSSMGFVVALALLNRVSTVGIPLLGTLLALLAAAAVVLGAAALAGRMVPQSRSTAAWLTATSPPLVYWAMSGMEMTAAAAANVWVALSILRFLSAGRIDRSSWAMVLVSMAVSVSLRPESPLVIACVLAGIAVVTRLAATAAVLRRVMWLAIALAAVVLLLTLLRMALFGDWLPQPVRAKAGGIAFRDGVAYLHRHLFGGVAMSTVTIVVAASVVGSAIHMLRRRRVDEGALLAILFLVAYCGFAVFTGGDWMECARFIVPVTGLATALTAAAIFRTPAQTKLRRSMVIGLIGVQTWAVASLAVGQSTGIPLGAAVVTQRSIEDDSPYNWFELSNRVHVRDILALELLRRAIDDVAPRAGDRPIVLMSGQMGMVPYYLKLHYGNRVRFIDRRGLCDRTLAGCPAFEGAVRSGDGLRIDYPGFFDRAEQFTSACSSGMPDIIYDLRPDQARSVMQNGYVLVSCLVGDVECSRRRFPGGRVSNRFFVAVRRDLSSGEPAPACDAFFASAGLSMDP